MGKILITGTGRAGTTVLVEILTNMGYDTGFQTVYEYQYDEASHAGLESRIDSTSRILKNPKFSLDIESIVEKIEIDFVIIPIRELELSANSRAKHANKNGGWFNATNLEEQIQTNLKIIYNLSLVLSKNMIPFCFLPFPDFLEKPSVLYKNLKFLFDEKGLSLEQVSDTIKKIYKPELITLK